MLPNWPRQNRDLECVTLPDGRRLALAFAGDPRGKPVFLFHGWPGSRFQRPPSAEHFRERGLRLITVDRPGIGASSPQPHRTLRDWPQDVAALADAMELPRFSVIGVSGGGPYALACARCLPRRVHKTILVGSLAPAALTPITHPAGLLLRLTRLTGWPAAAILRLLRRGVQGPVRQPPRWLLSLFPPGDRATLAAPETHAMLRRDFHAAMEPGIEGTLADIRLLARQWGVRLEKIRPRVEVFHGRRDRVVPPESARAMAARLPRGRLHLIRDAGHYDLPLQRLPVILDIAGM